MVLVALEPYTADLRLILRLVFIIVSHVCASALWFSITAWTLTPKPRLVLLLVLVKVYKRLGR